MANISIRKLDDQIYQQIRVRAAHHHVSIEEEIRQILAESVAITEPISHIFQKNFGKKNGIDFEISQERKPHDPLDFHS